MLLYYNIMLQHMSTLVGVIFRDTLKVKITNRMTILCYKICKKQFCAAHLWILVLYWKY
jgi:hypothetical protein